MPDEYKIVPLPERPNSFVYNPLELSSNGFFNTFDTNISQAVSIVASGQFASPSDLIPVTNFQCPGNFTIDGINSVYQQDYIVFVNTKPCIELLMLDKNEFVENPITGDIEKRSYFSVLIHAQSEVSEVAGQGNPELSTLESPEVNFILSVAEIVFLKIRVNLEDLIVWRGTKYRVKLIDGVDELIPGLFIHIRLTCERDKARSNFSTNPYGVPSL